MKEKDYSIHPSVGPREVLYRDQYQELYRVRLDFGKFSKELFVTDFGSRVGVIAEGPQGVLLTRQYRYLIDRISWEITGGKVDPEEKLEEAAARECLEETGVSCHTLTPLLMFHQGLDTAYNPTHLFYTSDFEEKVSREAFCSDEVIDRDWIPIDKCIAMVSSKEILDSLSVIAILSYNTFVKSMGISSRLR